MSDKNATNTPGNDNIVVTCLTALTTMMQALSRTKNYSHHTADPSVQQADRDRYRLAKAIFRREYCVKRNRKQAQMQSAQEDRTKGGRP